MGGKIQISAALPRGGTFIPIKQKAECTPQPIWTFMTEGAPPTIVGIRIADRPACSQVTPETCYPCPKANQWNVQSIYHEEINKEPQYLHLKT